MNSCEVLALYMAKPSLEKAKYLGRSIRNDDLYFEDVLVMMMT